jgi:hypothetical protein
VKARLANVLVNLDYSNVSGGVSMSEHNFCVAMFILSALTSMTTAVMAVVLLVVFLSKTHNVSVTGYKKKEDKTKNKKRQEKQIEKLKLEMEELIIVYLWARELVHQQECNPTLDFSEDMRANMVSNREHFKVLCWLCYPMINWQDLFRAMIEKHLSGRTTYEIRDDEDDDYTDTVLAG